jgi:hypothetical protein
VLSRAFVTICISPLTVDNVQSDKAGDQYGHLELPDDSFESGKPTGRPGKRKNISIGHRGERHKAEIQKGQQVGGRKMSCVCGYCRPVSEPKRTRVDRFHHLFL